MKHTTRQSLLLLSLALVLPLLAGDAALAADKDQAAIARGKELFSREWLPGDRRSHAGDGLGPLFNARSCAECHQQGGTGGAGAKHMNVRVVSAVLVAEQEEIGFFAMLFGAKPKSTKLQQPDRSKLAEIHPALRAENSFPLHRFATTKDYTNWKNSHFGGQISVEGGFTLAPVDAPPAASNSEEERLVDFTFTEQIGKSTVQFNASERNAPALFGLGLIDRIPEKAIQEGADSQARAAKKSDGSRARSGNIPPRLPVMGRVARLRDGRAGRFGWKAQTATLRDFTFQACATELGLEVPGFSQSPLPGKSTYKAPGLDLTAAQCDALVQFVASLPAPGRRPAETEQHAAEIAAGERLFERTGCTNCHRPKLGDVAGIYSDLLLHDMGPELSDDGQYGGTVVAGKGTGAGPEPLPVLDMSQGFRPLQGQPQQRPKFGAAPREWRTPPLWGLRHSAPYLHDGRADTIFTAIGFHGGEGQDSANKFFALALPERQQVELFLKSLAVPGQ